MKKIILYTISILILLIFFQISAKSKVSADWWIRPESRPSQPSEERNLPTLAPTTGPSQPTVVPTNPPTGGTPSTGGGGGGSSSGDGGNPCDPGKSYTGPYCGWSPSTSSGGGGGGSEQPRVGGSEVLGLSNTSSGELAFSDIIFLAGVLCLLIYVRSKIVVENKSH